MGGMVAWFTNGSKESKSTDLEAPMEAEPLIVVAPMEAAHMVVAPMEAVPMSILVIPNTVGMVPTDVALMITLPADMVSLAATPIKAGTVTPFMIAMEAVPMSILATPDTVDMAHIAMITFPTSMASMAATQKPPFMTNMLPCDINGPMANKYIHEVLAKTNHT